MEGKVETLELEDLREAINSLTDERAVASCGWRTGEMKGIPDELLWPYVVLLRDIEEGGEWPEFMEQVFTTMIEREEDPDEMEVDADKFVVPKPLDMRPINNFSPWYSAWSKARFKNMESWREKWMPEGMHGARETHEALEVVYEHMLFMEEQAAEGNPAAAISLDWSKFFDSVQREIGTELVKDMVNEGTGKKVFEAEERLLAKIKPRYKVGKTVGRSPYKKENGFFQGPNFSITVALATLSVWTRMTEEKVQCETSSFIDDSSVRSKKGQNKEDVAQCVAKALQESENFGKMTGAKLNKKKVKVLVNNIAIEERVKQLVPDLKEEAYRKAIILVGGIVSTGQLQGTKNQRAELQKRKTEKVEKTLKVIKSVPTGF